VSGGERVLITGASAGIGAEFARIFATKGHDLVLVARRQEKLEALADELRARGVGVTVIARDLASPGAAATLVETCASLGLDVDILINNAGVAYGGAFRKMDVAAVTALVQLNVVALAELTARLLPSMLARGAGRILNVSSLSAFQPVPSMALYAASKAFVLSFSEALSEELKGTGVTVTALCPGLTDTDMVSEATGAGAGLPEVPKVFVADVADVALEGYHACMNGEAVRVPGIGNRLGALWSTSTPRWLVRTMGGIFARTLLRD
jgi:short-subunit dehydrogenase